MMRENIHPIDVFAKLNDLAPGCNIDEIEMYGVVNTQISKIGVCVEPTVDIIYEADKINIELLISHYPPEKTAEEKARKLGLYGLVLGLRQDVSKEGNLTSFAETVGLMDITPVAVEINNRKTIQTGQLSVEYDNMQKANLGIIGRFKTKKVKRKEYHAGDYYCFPRGLGPCKIDPRLDIDDTKDKVRYDFGERYDFVPEVKYLANRDSKEIRCVAVSTTMPLNSSVLQSVISSGLGVDCYICGSPDNETLNLAKEKRIDLMDIGGYAVGIPGMVRLAKNLGCEFLYESKVRTRN